MRTTPLHPRTAALNTAFAWKEWSGYAAACTFDRHSEREYFAVRQTAGLLDVTPLYKLEVRGPDAGALLSRLFTRDVARIGVGRVVYGCLCDERGRVLDDGTVARLAEDHFRLSTSIRWAAWAARHARGYDVTLHDSTDELAVLALQGPRARHVLRGLLGLDVDRIRFFRARETTLAGRPIWISRTGYTGDLGFELWIPNEHALGVWDALLEAGRPHGLQPMGLDALDVLRIEAGFVLQGVDYTSALHALIPSRESTPAEIGLGWTVDLDREPGLDFLGGPALRAAANREPAWALVGVELDVAGLEALYEEFGLPPHLAPRASRDGLPLYDRQSGRQVGQITSHTWSPVTKRLIGLASVRASHAAVGTPLLAEHTVEYERRRVAAQVVPTPFFDPPRKRATPGRPPAEESPP